MPAKPKTATCPICSKPATPEYRPFCSARCKQVDLGRWLKGDYVIPGPAVTDEEESKSQS
jgi:endogenous inhibitor of DNA gyrase (YacG/DUF329 family)